MAYGTGSDIAQSKLAAVSRQPELDTHTDRINEAAKDVHEVADRLHGIADRIFGSQPQPIGKDPQGRPPAVCVIGRLLEAHESLGAGRSRLREAVDRLAAL